MSDVDAVVQQQAVKAHPPVTYVNTDKSLGTAQGGYTAFVTNAAGQVVDVREPDGTHLTPGGGQVVAQQVIAQLQALGYHISRLTPAGTSGSDQRPGIRGPAAVVDQLGQGARG